MGVKTCGGTRRGKWTDTPSPNPLPQGGEDLSVLSPLPVGEGWVRALFSSPPKRKTAPEFPPGPFAKHVPASRGTRAILLDGDGGAGFFELLLDLFGFLLGDVFLDGLRSAFHQVLGFFQAEV